MFLNSSGRLDEKEGGWKMLSRMKLWFLSRDVDLSVMYKIEFHILPSPNPTGNKGCKFKGRKAFFCMDKFWSLLIYKRVQICINFVTSAI